MGNSPTGKSDGFPGEPFAAVGRTVERTTCRADGSPNRRKARSTDRANCFTAVLVVRTAERIGSTPWCLQRIGWGIAVQPWLCQAPGDLKTLPLPRIGKPAA